MEPEEKILTMMTGLLINYSVYLSQEKGIEIKYQDIKDFQNWIIKQNEKHNGKEPV